MPVPKSLLVLATGILASQICLPSRSYAIRPHEPKYATTTLPSVAGVLAAGLPSVLWYASIWSAGACFRHSSLPSLAA